MTNDDEELSAASAGSVAERPLGDPEIAVEILRLRVEELETAIRRLADQDATLSVQGGNVIVEMDATPVVRLPALDPSGAPGWNAAIGAVREALADAGVDWDTE